MVIGTEAFIRKVTNRSTHVEFNLLQLSDTFNHVPDLIAKSGIAEEDPKDMDYSEELRKIKRILYESEDYFDKKEKSIELAIEAYVQEEDTD